jgi:transposase
MIEYEPPSSYVDAIVFAEGDRPLYQHPFEALRIMAVDQVKAGERASVVATRYSFHHCTVHGWLRAAHKSNEISQPHRPIPAFSGNGKRTLLTVAQQRRMLRWINSKSPVQYGLDANLWTQQIVCDLIAQRFGHQLSPASVEAMLAGHGLSPDDSRRQARQLASEAMQHWQQTSYPLIARHAEQADADLCFWNVAHAGTGHELDAGYAVTDGDMPQPVPGICTASVVTADSAFWFTTYSGEMSGRFFISLLQRLMHRRTRPLHLIVDSHPAYQAPIIASYVARLQGRLILHYLPDEPAGLATTA